MLCKIFKKGERALRICDKWDDFSQGKDTLKFVRAAFLPKLQNCCGKYRRPTGDNVRLVSREFLVKLYILFTGF